MPDSALRMRVLPSKANGLVTTAMVRIPMSRAISATTGAAPVPVPPPMPAGHEHQIRALERAGDLLAALLGGLLADFRRCARAETLGQLFADLDHRCRAARAERLHVGVHRDEVHANHAAIHHAIERVSAAAAASDDLDGSCRALVHFNFKHRKSPFCFAFKVKGTTGALPRTPPETGGSGLPIS